MNEIIIAHMTAMKDAINGNNNNNRNIPEIDDFFLDVHCYYLFIHEPFKRYCLLFHFVSTV